MSKSAPPLLTDLSEINLDPSDFTTSLPLKKVPHGDLFSAARAGDVDRLGYLLQTGVNVNARDKWDSTALYYACLAGHLDAARMLLESGAICSEHTFDGDRCHYAALHLKVRKLLKAFEARPPPLGPLQAALRDTFLGCLKNGGFFEVDQSLIAFSGPSILDGPNPSHFPADVVFYVHGRPIEAHRVILSARSPYFKQKFDSDWKYRKEVKLSREKLSYAALYSLIHFFYSDRLEIAVDDMEDLVRICKVCRCETLQRVIEKELVHQRYAEYKALREIDSSQRRFILQGTSLPEEERLPAALYRILEISLANSILEEDLDYDTDKLVGSIGRLKIHGHKDDLADICVKVDGRVFRCHQVVLASRSEYFKTRISRMDDFLELNNDVLSDALCCLQEHDLSHAAFEKMIEYMYTDSLKVLNPLQAEELFDAASRYLLFPLKRAVADALLSHIETATPSDLCHWLLLADMYQLPLRSTRGVPPKRYDPDFEAQRSKYPISSISEGNLSKTAIAFNTALYSIDIPKTVEEALKREEWRKAMEDEMTALRKNETWEKCQLPKDTKVVGCRWVFSVKYQADGKIERYKARLVAKGYTQTYGVDYSETFSPVAKIDTIRVLFSIAANKEWPLHQLDVKNAFLHGEIEEEVYMEAPPGFSGNFKSNEGCRLKKAIYGLKQSPRAWFGRFTTAMKKFGYKQSNSDHTLFLKRNGDQITCLIIYVDDMIITGNDTNEIIELKQKLSLEFEMKDLGNLKYFLSLEVLRSKRGIFISQRKYILDLLADTGMLDCKPADTPIITNHGLQILGDGQAADKGLYQRMVGKLIYLSHTRPDIAYAVGVVSRFMHLPQTQHMEAVMRIIRYLKGTSSRGICFWKHGHLEIYAYTDADWAGDKDGRKSTSGYFTLVGGNLVTWKSKKQKVVALSSAEAEFRGIAKGITEILWIRKLMTELGLPQNGACKLYCDNKAAISISENPVQHDRTKHVEIDRHFIKEKLENNVICLPFVRSKDQLADILTKAIGTEAFESTLCKLGIGDPTTQLEGECGKT